MSNRGLSLACLQIVTYRKLLSSSLEKCPGAKCDLAVCVLLRLVYIVCLRVPQLACQPKLQRRLVEPIGIEPMTPCLQSRCSPS